MNNEHNIMDTEDSFFIKLNELISNNIENSDYTLDDLCRNLHISRSQLHRKVKEVSGLSTTLYIRKYKLIKAKALLRESELKISEVAYAIGLNSPQAFSKYFSNEFGLSPTQFRNSLVPESSPSHTEPIDAEVLSIPQNRESDTENNVTEPSSSISISPTPLDTGSDSKSRKSTLSMSFILAGILVMVLIGVQSFRNSESNNTLEFVKKAPRIFNNSIAVLPFSNLGDPESDQICGGLQEDILTNLSFFKDLKVISRTSSEAYKNTKKSVVVIGNELGVEYLLEGSVQLNGQQISVNTQLIDANDDSHVWANKYVRDIDDIFKIQNEISIEVARILNDKITASTEAQISNNYEPGREAHKDFLIGKELLKERTHTSLLASIEHFNKALKLEPNYVGAIVLKSNAYQLLGNIGYDRRQEYIDKSEKYALEVIKLDPKNGLAYAMIACKYKDNYQWEQAKVTFEIALDHDPNNALINYWYSLLLREIGDTDQAVKFSSRAKELDPLYPVIHAGHIVNLAYAGRTAEASKALETGDLLFKQSFLHHWAKAVYAESISDYNLAINSFERVLELNPELTSAHKYILFNKARLGQSKEVHDEITNIKSKTPVDYFTLATMYSGLNNAELSAQYFVEAMKQGKFPSDILVDRNYDIIRDLDAYKQMLDKYNLTSFAEKMKNENK